MTIARSCLSKFWLLGHSGGVESFPVSAADPGLDAWELPDRLGAVTHESHSPDRLGLDQEVRAIAVDPKPASSVLLNFSLQSAFELRAGTSKSPHQNELADQSPTHVRQRFCSVSHSLDSIPAGALNRARFQGSLDVASHHGAAASGVIAITNPCFSLSTPGVPEMRNAGSRQKPDQPPTLYKSSKTQCAADSELLKKSEARLISSILDERGQNRGEWSRTAGCRS